MRELLAHTRSLIGLMSAVLLALSVTASSAYAQPRVSKVADKVDTSSTAVVGGLVTDANGTTAPGEPVDLYAWPSDTALKAMKAGQQVPTTLIGTTTTNTAGKFMLRVPAAKLAAAAVESGYANLEIFSAVGGVWFLSYQTSSLPAHPSVPVIVNLSAKKRPSCGKDPLGRLYGFSGFFKLKRKMKPAWAVVGQGYVVPTKKTKGDFMQFDYNKGANHSQTSGLGVGISGHGLDVGYNTSGSNTSTSDSEQDFPSETKNTLFRTEFTLGQFRGECHGAPNDSSVPQQKQKSFCPRKFVPIHGLVYYVHKCLWMVHSTGWFGFSSNVVHPSSSPHTPGRFCGPELKNSTGKTHHQQAIQWTHGFDIGLSNKIKGVTSKITFSSSAQTGYDTDDQMLFTFRKAGWICGTNKIPAHAAQLVMRGNRT